MKKRKNLVIHYIYKGKGILRCADKTYNLKEGQSFVIYPDRIIGCTPDPEEPWAYTWMVFDGDELKTLLERIDFIEDDCVIDYIPKEKIKYLYDCMVEIGNATSFNIVREGLAIAILGLYISEFPRTHISVERDIFDSVLQYIRYNFDNTECNVKTLAKKFNLSSTTLYRIFKKNKGISPEKYLSMYRITKAKKFLESDLPIKVVSSSCGYSNPMYFSQVFKRETGYTPSEYAAKFAFEESGEN